MLSKKIAILLLAYCLPALGRNTSTQLVHFHVTNDDISAMAKTFINDTKHKVRIRWRLIDRKTHEFIGQEPIVLRGGKIDIDVESFMPQFEKGAGLSGYDFSIEVARILKMPQQKGDDIETCSFKNGPSDLQISKRVYLAFDDFALLQNKAGILSYKASGGVGPN